MADPAADVRFLDIFPNWLRSLGQDAADLGQVVGQGGPEGVRRWAASGLNYIFKSLDLIPDGIDDLGFMDDAFVLRVAAALAVAEDGAAKTGVVGRLADEGATVRDFLGADYERLERYVRDLPRGAARGRTVDDILGDDSVRTAFVNEVNAWSKGYQVPSFTRDPKTLIKLRSFLSAKLA
jgi:uncharacterized membrane protein YkvA (DUF1232 family)